ncbi:MAG TPA: hypothetical protein VN419_01695 [Humidesulfovibrio sp.]|uniref:alginate O-acetyltransferase AlgX-related protein n=1 Tax=Humidesulfovibrio sp. TaxID=2910988 RepID=UPI002B653670|nr:hypothetical protein [Humidesulfovibrio sp.]HWR02704.1 hypothetical protein [Humidesulfovibrio sp.]
MRLPKNRFLASLLFVPAALILLLALGELYFRMVSPAPDVPALAMRDGVLRHQPGQQGTYRDHEASAPFAINAQGWNSGRAAYPQERPPRSCPALRIAVVGGALAEALEVPPQASLAEDLERELAAQPCGIEVFRYGMDGAPLSQHLLMARRAVLPARPDILVVLLAPEDIAASHQPGGGALAAHFQKLRLDAEDTVEELPPLPYAPTFSERLRQASALVRHLTGPEGLRPALAQRLLRRPRPDRRFEAAATAAAEPATAREEREALDRRAARYLFGQLKAEASEAGARLLVVMDGARAELESGAAGTELERALEQNRLAAAEAELLGVAFLDLHQAFAEDLRWHKKPFGSGDGQWNAYGHAVAASAVAEKLSALGWLNGPSR